MKVKKLFAESGIVNCMVVETENGFLKFNMTPARVLTERDLSPLPYYQAVGKKREEAGPLMYAMYGLEKERKEDA